MFQRDEDGRFISRVDVREGGAWRSVFDAGQPLGGHRRMVVEHVDCEAMLAEVAAHRAARDALSHAYERSQQAAADEGVRERLSRLSERLVEAEEAYAGGATRRAEEWAREIIRASFSRS